MLKYDEVMNEQRKVIYLRRDQILEGTDLKSAAMEYLAEAVDALIERHCVSDAEDEWDLEGLAQELASYYPSKITAAELERGRQHRQDVRPGDAGGHRVLPRARGANSASRVMREVERQVMLRIIDQRWREHLYEMDYLQEGINLRAMGQKDPLTEWQREGYEMFGQLMKGIADDFVRYVMHVQVVQKEPARARRFRTFRRRRPRPSSPRASRRLRSRRRPPVARSPKRWRPAPSRRRPPSSRPS